MKTLVVTFVLSEECTLITPWTLPRQQAYARRIGADHMVRGIARPDLELFWQRLTATELFAVYDRILILDADTLVRGDCPDLFEVVPPDLLGMANEAHSCGEGGDNGRRQAMIDYYRDHELPWEGWSGNYYNVGVMVTGRCHVPVLEIPDNLWRGREMLEQDLVNARIHAGAVPVYNLGWQYNRMPALVNLPGTPADPREAYIIHYAGGSPFEARVPVMSADDAAWKGLGL